MEMTLEEYGASLKQGTHKLTRAFAQNLPVGENDPKVFKSDMEKLNEAIKDFKKQGPQKTTP